jgi:hypothetical protein
MPDAAPVEEYTRRLEDRRRAHADLSARDARLSYARLGVFAAGAIVALLAFWTGTISGAWLIAPLAVFIWLMARHERVIGMREAAARAIAFYERGLARVEDRWIGTGEPGERFLNDEHLYANDLDLFGRGSLFELLSIARTRTGEETLASWLLAPAGPGIIRARQQAVDELAPRLDLREHLALAGSDVRAGVHTEALLQWAAMPPVLDSSWPRVVAGVLTAAAVITVTIWIVAGAAEPFLAVVAAEILFTTPLRRRVDRVLHASEQPARDMDILAHVLERLEAERFDAERLRVLRASLDTGGLPASRAIAHLHRLSELHDWQHNQFFAPFAAALLWGTHLAFAIEAWKRRHAGQVDTWLRTVGEFEALGSLGAYRYEHPADAWPAILESAPATFDGDALGHPLLPAARMVPNDVHLTGDVRLLVVSGSNMSGKSTLLRTVGVNAVLAQAGAPARAARLHLTPCAIGATLRIQDSLQEGRSRFFAEITRLRRLSDVAKGPVPLLFLLDELFHGTNSHDRLFGAVGVLRSFLDRGAIGLITTHDLALAAVADDLAPRAVNVHFEDTFEGGEIHFDYRLKPGPVRRSNALALMRAVGLDVDDPPES